MNRLYTGIFITLSLLAVAVMQSCNSKSNGNEYVPASDVAVTKFTLKADSKVTSKLDSVFFALDLNNGLIYNADSLPVGSDVSKLVPVITYPSSVKEAVITMEGGDVRTGDVDYIKNPSDSIDFTGTVTLKLTAEDGVTSKSYRIKVNVHQMKPDSLWWDRTAVAPLPSRMDNPKQQKSLAHNDKVWTLIEEADGSFTISSTEAPNRAQWDKQQPQFTFAPDIRSFAATDDAFYILDINGTLHKSSDAITWSSAGVAWASIIGGYGNTLQGVKYSGTMFVHTAYPAGSFEEYPVEDGFPYSNSSNMVIYTSKWGVAPLGMITGGVSLNGLTGYTWAFDGAKWSILSNNEITPVADGVMIPYYTYVRHSTTNVLSEYSVMLYIGGREADGTISRKIWISYSNGVSWAPAPESMVLPEYMPGMWKCDYAVVNTPLEASFAPEIWKSMYFNDMRVARYTDYHTDGYNVSWNCPYIYLFGGCDPDGKLYDTVWKGVLNRLSFKPIM